MTYHPGCWCAAESLDELSDIVVELFSEICNKNIPVPIVTELPFSADELQMQTNQRLQPIYSMTMWMH